MAKPRSSEAPARKHAPPEERRAQILEAALGCFSARGFHATTMDHLVAASGLSKGSLYWHFESKDDVFLALFDAVAGELFRRFDVAFSEGEADVLTLMRQELEGFFERFGSERRLLLAWAEFAGHPEARARMALLYREIRAQFADIVRLGIETGQLRALSPDGTAAVLTGMVDALLLQAAIDPAFELSEHLEALWDVLYRGVAPDREAGSA